MGANFGAAGRASGGERGDRRVDFDDDRAALRERIEGPNRYRTGQRVQDSHPAQARLADLRRADQVEVRIRPAAQPLLRALGHAEAAASAAEPSAFARAVAAEVERGLGVIDEAGYGEVRIVDA